jgi:alpha-beta hydrolase superfamily lysophospholipase
MRYEESNYVGYDGTRMFMSVWLPGDEPPRALLVAIHGLGSHGYTLRNIGEYFAQRGLAVFAPDMRGFGHYSGLKGHVISFDEYKEDLKNIVDQVKDRFQSRLTYLFGHSLGGLHAIRYVAAYPQDVEGAMLSCPAVSESLKIGRATKAAGSLLSVLNVKRYFGNSLEFEYASHDPEVVQEHENDKLRFDKVTPRFGISALRAMREAFRAAPLIMLPILVQQAGEDMMVNPDMTRTFFDRLGSADKTWKIYEGFYHELHGEMGRDQVLNDMYAWLERRLTR